MDICCRCNTAIHKQHECLEWHKRQVNFADDEDIYDEALDDNYVMEDNAITDDGDGIGDLQYEVKDEIGIFFIPAFHNPEEQSFSSSLFSRREAVDVIIDSGSNENIDSSYMVSKLNLSLTPHSSPYSISWIKCNCTDKLLLSVEFLSIWINTVMSLFVVS